MANRNVATTQKRNSEDQDGHRYDQMPSNGTRDPDGHQSGSGEVSMQCGVLRAHLLLNLPSQSRMVRQGSLGLRVELDSGDDVVRGYTWALRSAQSRGETPKTAGKLGPWVS